MSNCLDCGCPMFRHPSKGTARPTHCKDCYPKAVKAWEVRAEKEKKEADSKRKYKGCFSCGGTGKHKSYTCTSCGGTGKTEVSEPFFSSGTWHGFVEAD